ncbi:hypothetical protein ACJ2CR_23920 [Myxococcus faecalis]|uniref:hypothetical protein n=1 Tax=Myxococcus faecalis TaxID=3115646 RepID=UPI0038D05359
MLYSMLLVFTLSVSQVPTASHNQDETKEPAPKDAPRQSSPPITTVEADKSKSSRPTDTSAGSTSEGVGWSETVTWLNKKLRGIQRREDGTLWRSELDGQTECMLHIGHLSVSPPESKSGLTAFKSHFWVPMREIPMSGLRRFTNKLAEPCIELVSDKDNIGTMIEITGVGIPPQEVRPRAFEDRATICFNDTDIGDRSLVAIQHLAKLCGAPKEGKPEPF